jgi:RNA polymerase sigma-70 factor (ECF subfamily)
VRQTEDVPAAQHARFQDLVGPHLGRLLRFASRRVRNLADAEDVVQEACTRAWLAFADLRHDGLALPWLYRILRSSLSDFHGKQDRREQLAPTLTLESADDIAASEADGPLEELIAAASTERILELLRILPEEFALAIELHDLEGLRYRDIAETTGVAIGTVMSRIHRGRKLLAGLIVMNDGFSDLVASRSLSDLRLHKRGA